jgi:hypothetical protein
MAWEIWFGAFWRYGLWFYGGSGLYVLVPAIIIVEGCVFIRGINPLTTYDYFMAMLPPDALRCVVTLTSEKLYVIEKLVMRIGEIPKSFGISTAVAPSSISSHNNALCPPGIWDED